MNGHTRAETALGLHVLLDVDGAPFQTLDDPLLIRKALVEAVRVMGARILNTSVARLHPQGVSAAILISESHVTIHTWPERGEAAVDLFTCGDPEAARRAMNALAAKLGGRVSRRSEVVRGGE